MAPNQTAFSTQNQTNLTNSLPSSRPPNWSVEPIFFCAFAVIGLVTNGVPLLAFIKNRALFTPFNIYVLHIFILNVIASAVRNPLAVVIYFYPLRPICTADHLLQNLLNGGCVKTHAAMAVNRAWAILHPLSYRNYHSKKFSFRVLIGLWLFQVTFTGAYWILNDFLHRPPAAAKGCALGTDLLPVAIQVNYVIPMVLILISFICVSPRILRRLKRHSAGRSHSMEMSRETDIKRAHVARRSGDQSSGVPATVIEETLTKVKGRRFTQRSGAYVVLTLLTASVTVCYLPEILHFLLSYYMKAFYMPALLSTFKLLYSAQTILDPILMVAALGKLRASVLTCGVDGRRVEDPRNASVTVDRK